jgi:hypothetical protein
MKPGCPALGIISFKIRCEYGFDFLRLKVENENTSVKVTKVKQNSRREKNQKKNIFHLAFAVPQTQLSYINLSLSSVCQQ